MEMDRKQSKREFKKVKNWLQFLELWSKFYSNQIEIPGYYGKFISEKGDNPEANEELGKIFRDITRMELFCDGSQASVKGEQKAYFTGYTFPHIAYPLFIELNRYEGISAIMLDLSNKKKTDGFSFFPFVTYSDWNDETKKYGIGNRILGSSSTHLGMDFGTADLTFISEWLNEDMQEIINEQNMCHLSIWDANTSSPPFHLFEVIKTSLRRVREQNELFFVVDSGDEKKVVKMITEMKAQNINPDVQQTGYRGSTSMIMRTVSNFLSSGKEKFRNILNILVKEIECFDVNLYNELKRRNKKEKFPEERIEYVLSLLQKKLPKWNKDDEIPKNATKVPEVPEDPEIKVVLYQNELYRDIKNGFVFEKDAKGDAYLVVDETAKNLQREVTHEDLLKAHSLGFKIRSY